MKKIQALTVLLVFGLSIHSAAQPIKVPESLDRWDTAGSKAVVENYLGKQSIFLKSGPLVLKNAQFEDGIIEFDFSLPTQRGFPGFAFRAQDLKNTEYFYFRPHQSGNPDATQYTPVYNGYAGWQLYHGEGYSKAFTYNFNGWHHLKMDVHGLQAEIYIDDMEKPFMKITELKREWQAGKMAFVAEVAPIHFANFQFTTKQGNTPVRPKTPDNGTNGFITKWMVSNAVNRSFFDGRTQLSSEQKSYFKWSTQQSEPSGTINLAKFIPNGDTNRTVIARFDIESSTDKILPMNFGFSDYVTVYVNDNAVYSGADNFMSRDYRYLGTIGLFDEVYLPLKKGNNEIWFVVSEDFGGWGVKAKIENMDQISLK